MIITSIIKIKLEEKKKLTIIMIIICFNLGVVCDQEELWMETVADDPATEEEACQSGLTPISIDPRLYHDIPGSAK